MNTKLEWRECECYYRNYIRLERNADVSEFRIIGITRIRNESLILEDTLNHMSSFVDAIIVLDDDSTDNTVDIAKSHDKVVKILCNKNWSKHRSREETVHRQMLLQEARTFDCEWIFYFDADERFDIDKEQILLLPPEIDGIKVRLFDAYMTKDDNIPYTSDKPLWDFRKNFGPEIREILMIFRNTEYINFKGFDSRIPKGCKSIETLFFCQHYGKAISKDRWERSCVYYSTYFPQPYKTKWNNRKNKSIHRVSDFGNELCTWEYLLKNPDGYIKVYQPKEYNKPSPEKYDESSLEECGEDS